MTGNLRSGLSLSRSWLICRSAAPMIRRPSSVSLLFGVDRCRQYASLRLTCWTQCYGQIQIQMYFCLCGESLSLSSLLSLCSLGHTFLSPRPHYAFPTLLSLSLTPTLHHNIRQTQKCPRHRAPLQNMILIHIAPVLEAHSTIHPLNSYHSKLALKIFTYYPRTILCYPLFLKQFIFNFYPKPIFTFYTWTILWLFIYSIMYLFHNIINT